MREELAIGLLSNMFNKSNKQVTKELEEAIREAIKALSNQAWLKSELASLEKDPTATKYKVFESDLLRIYSDDSYRVEEYPGLVKGRMVNLSSVPFIRERKSIYVDV